MAPTSALRLALREEFVCAQRRPCVLERTAPVLRDPSGTRGRRRGEEPTWARCPRLSPRLSEPASARTRAEHAASGLRRSLRAPQAPPLPALGCASSVRVPCAQPSRAPRPRSRSCRRPPLGSPRRTLMPHKPCGFLGAAFSVAGCCPNLPTPPASFSPFLPLTYPRPHDLLVTSPGELISIFSFSPFFSFSVCGVVLPSSLPSCDEVQFSTHSSNSNLDLSALLPEAILGPLYLGLSACSAFPQDPKAPSQTCPNGLFSRPSLLFKTARSPAGRIRPGACSAFPSQSHAPGSRPEFTNTGWVQSLSPNRV